jgi:hypothetical protein
MVIGTSTCFLSLRVPFYRNKKVYSSRGLRLFYKIPISSYFLATTSTVAIHNFGRRVSCNV